MHIFGDLLSLKWNRNTPLNEGFTLTRIFPLHSAETDSALLMDVSQIDLKLDSEDHEASGALTSASPGVSGAEAGNGSPSAEETAVAAGTDGEREGEGGSAAACGDNPIAAVASSDLGRGKGEQEEGRAEEGPSAAAGNESSQPQQVDAMLEALLLRALYYVVKDKQLPMLVSNLWLTLLR